MPWTVWFNLPLEGLMNRYIIWGLFLLCWVLNAEEYLAIKPSEIVVDPATQVPIMVSLYKNGKPQPQVLPWDFKFKAEKGSFSGNVYNAPSQPGTYLIFVYYRKVMGLAMVTVQATEAVKSIKLIPQRVILSPGEKTVFRADVTGKSGAKLNFMPAWGTKGGKIDQNGRFHAGKKSGEYTIIAWGPKGIKATAIVIIRAKPQIARLAIVPEKATVDVGASLRFRAQAFDQFGKKHPTNVGWSTNAGKITASGEFTAGDKPGNYEITARQGSAVARAFIEVKAIVRQLTRLKITPDSLKIQAGKRQLFQVHGYDQFGKEMPVSPSWTASGGKITDKGLFTAGPQADIFIVSARQGNISAEVRGEIQAIPRWLTRMELVPKNASLKVGEKINFQVNGYDQFGAPLPVAVSWNASGGEINVQGLFTAGATPGIYTIIARHGKISAKTLVKIRALPARLTKLQINPQQMQLEPGAQTNFTVSGYDQYGKPMPVAGQWQASGGKIDQQGRFTAGDQTGIFKISVRHDKLRAQAQVEIRLKPAILTRLTIKPERLQLEPGAQANFTVSGYDQYDKPMPVAGQWQASGGKIDQQGRFTAGDQTGIFKISVRHDKLRAQAQVEIRLKPAILTRLTIKPERLQLEPGAQANFTVSGYDQYDKPMPVAGQWQASGGKIDQQGRFTAGDQTGIFKISVRHDKLRAQAQVEIRLKPAILTRLTIKPEQLQLEPGAQANFTVSGYDQYNKPMPVAGQWQASGGKIDQQGRFTAGDQTGIFKISVRHDKLQAQAQVENPAKAGNSYPADDQTGTAPARTRRSGKFYGQRLRSIWQADAGSWPVAGIWRQDRPAGSLYCRQNGRNLCHHGASGQSQCPGINNRETDTGSFDSIGNRTPACTDSNRRQASI